MKKGIYKQAADDCLEQLKIQKRRVMILEKELDLLSEQCGQRQAVIESYQRHFKQLRKQARLAHGGKNS